MTEANITVSGLRQGSYVDFGNGGRITSISGFDGLASVEDAGKMAEVARAGVYAVVKDPFPGEAPLYFYGAALGSGMVAANLRRFILLGGNIIAGGSVTADLTAINGFHANATGGGAVAAQLSLTKFMAASVAAAGGSNAAMTREYDLVASVINSSATSAALTKTQFMQSQANGLGAVAAVLSRTASFTASAAGSGATSAALTKIPGVSKAFSNAFSTAFN